MTIIPKILEEAGGNSNISDTLEKAREAKRQESGSSAELMGWAAWDADAHADAVEEWAPVEEQIRASAVAEVPGENGVMMQKDNKPMDDGTG